MKPSNQAMAEEWVAGSVLMEAEYRQYASLTRHSCSRSAANDVKSMQKCKRMMRPRRLQNTLNDGRPKRSQPQKLFAFLTVRPLISAGEKKKKIKEKMCHKFIRLDKTCVKRHHCIWESVNEFLTFVMTSQLNKFVWWNDFIRKTWKNVPIFLFYVG